MNTMTYRDFSAQIEYSEDDGCFVGHLAGIDDLIGFHGDSVVELRLAFSAADTKWCKLILSLASIK